ncbi:hypothetical protein ACC739_38070 [Rhizobium ruizarguesonis]
MLASASLVVFCLVGYAIVQLTNEVLYDDVVGALAAFIIFSSSCR